MNYAGVLLAAGASRRLGQPKQLLQLDGETLLHRAARALVDGCAPIIVVLGAVADECQNALQDLPVQTVVNENWRAGMGSSIAVGMATLDAQAPDVEAAILALCDQPFLNAALVGALIHQYEISGCSIVACDYGAALGPPALFARTHFAELAQLSGEQGARRLFAEYETACVPFPQGRADIDTLSDWRALNDLKKATK